MTEKFAMLIMKSEKRQTTGKRELPSQESVRTLREKVFENIGSGNNQRSRNEGKNKKRVPQQNEKASQHQALQQKSHWRDKYLGR